MMPFLTFVYTFFYSLITFKSYKCAKLFLYYCHNVGKNNFYYNKCTLEFVKCNITGNNNSVYWSGISHRTIVNIIGDNNQVVFGNNVIVNGSTIMIKGDNCRIIIGDNTRISSGQLICMGTNNYITIGDDCMFAPNTELWSSDTHPVIDSNGNILNPSKPISIDNHVWLGKGVRVLKGVSIGQDSIVGMYSVVTKDIPKASLAVGLPAKVVRQNINWKREFIDC